jgi:hypothetical protein
MKDFYIEKTLTTPQVKILPADGLLTIEGRSIPEDPVDFYSRIIEKMEEYFLNPRIQTRIEIKLEYVNSGSSKYLLELLRAIKHHYDQGSDCLVIWYYEEEDESIHELGDHFLNTIKLPFQLKGYY